MAPHVPLRSAAAARPGSGLGRVRRLAAAMAGVTFAVGSLGLAAARADATGAVEWPMFQGGPAHTGAAPEGVDPPLKPTWRYPATGGAVVSSPVVVGKMVIVETSDSVVGIDDTTGNAAWTHGRESGPVAPVAFDPDALGGLIVFSQGEVGSAGLVAAPLESLETPTSGKLSGPHPKPAGWTFTLDKPTRGAPTIVDGNVFVATDGGTVYAVDVTTGQQVWQAKAGGAVVGAPAVSDGKVFVVAGNGKDFHDRLIAYDETTGKQAWAYSQTIGVAAATAPSVAGGRVFVGLGDGSVRAFRAANGDPLWAQGAGSEFRANSAPAVSGDSVYATDSGAALDRFAVDDGRRTWNFLFDQGIVVGAPLVSSSVVYVGLSDGSVAAVNVSTGNLVWRSVAGGGSVGPLAAGGDALFAQHQGSQGSIVAFARDPQGALTDIASPSRLDPGRALLDFLVALAIVVVFLAVFWVLETRVRRRGREVAA